VESNALSARESVIQPTAAISPESNNTAKLRRFPQDSSSGFSSQSAAIDGFASGLDSNVTQIDLPGALQLGGWNSPEVLLAQQRVLAASARRQLAAAQVLPNLNLGTSFDSHTGALQTSSGLIENVQRSSMYVGAGANAVGSGTVNIPGLQYNLNVGEAYYANLVARQQSERAQAASVASKNNILQRICVAYCQLVRAQGTRAIAVKARDDAAEVAKITASFAKIGQGRPADAERARTEVGRRDADIFTAESEIIEASSRLGQILNLESSVRLQSNENWIVPRSIVPEPIPLAELIAIALYRRPEIAERRAAVHAAMLELDNAKMLLFSPQFIAGFSDGAFGGGSDINAAATGSPRFGSFTDRTDLDIVLYWSIRNLGLANRALIRTSTARLAAADWERTKRFNEIRAEVADAYARTQARAAQLDLREQAVTSSEEGFREDLRRAFAGEGRPIEVLDSLRLRALAQQDYLDTIANYNQAQYELYVAIGEPPADLLIHTEPATIPPSPDGEPK
jgi:outer membrane protein TolC